MQKKLVIANWKMNPQTFAEAKRLFNGIKKAAGKYTRVKTVVCPPFVFLGDLAYGYSGRRILFGSQNIFLEDRGSYTGEISPLQVKDSGAVYSVIGHSERRARGETDADVKSKLALALKHKLVPVLCIGEHERDHHGKYLAFLRHQISTAFKGVKPKDMSRVVIAYEPIWAIGKTGSDAITPKKLHETVLFIRRVLLELYTKKIAFDVTILYGGSVEPENTLALFEEGTVQGFLVGHASLSAESFGRILEIVNGAK